MRIGPRQVCDLGVGFGAFARLIAGPDAPHAWLVTSPTAGGAVFFGRALARAALCEATDRPPRGQHGSRGDTATPCEDCPTCRRTAAGSHPGLTELWPRGIQIRIEQAHALREAACLRLQGRKVFLLHRAERLGPEAGNALLKVFEEPPPRTLFVLATHHPDAVLPTLVSRVRRAKVTLPSARALVAALGLDERAARALELTFAVTGPSPQAVLGLAAVGALDEGPIDLARLSARIDEWVEGIDPTGFPTPVHALLESAQYSVGLVRAIETSLGLVAGSANLRPAMEQARRLTALHEEMLDACERAGKEILSEAREGPGRAVGQDLEEDVVQTRRTLGRLHQDLVLRALGVVVESALMGASGSRGGAAPAPSQTAALVELGRRLGALQTQTALNVSAADIFAEVYLTAAFGPPVASVLPPAGLVPEALS